MDWDIFLRVLKNQVIFIIIRMSRRDGQGLLLCTKDPPYQIWETIRSIRFQPSSGAARAFISILDTGVCSNRGTPRILAAATSRGCPDTTGPSSLALQ